ncbi:MAG: hypothetical protein COB62_02620 [Piscirickettsiaceae bacterium]|nr:MAG: hypothetical protein COB62_02620 [Piscirickettsiaceae bacterium]
MPIDIIKIDGVLVKNMISELVDKAEVEAIVRLSNEMCIICVAEFVENIETKIFLRFS